MIPCGLLRSSFSLPAAYRALQQSGKITKRQSNDDNIMKTASDAWKQLTSCQKHQLITAHKKHLAVPVKNEHQRNSKEHSTTDFNLIMRLLFSDKMKFGCKDIVVSGSLGGRMAKKTLRLLSDDDRVKLRRHFSVKGQREKWNKKMYEMEVLEQPPTEMPITRHRSFREMFDKLYKEDPFTVYLAVATSMGKMRRTAFFQQTLLQKWNRLTPELRALYCPITDEEASRFERHCAAASLERDSVQVPILELFCSFRQIPYKGGDAASATAATGGKVGGGSNSAPNAKVLERARMLYRQDCRHTYIERVRHSMARATRNLESDAPRDPAARRQIVSPSRYSSAFKGKNEMQLAKKMVSERYGVTVFDEVVKYMKK